MSFPRTRRLLLAVAAAAALGAPAAQAGAPSDPFFGDQWALQPGAPLDVAKAWQVTRGAGTVVAVLDSGADLGHRDLREALWRNPGEIAGNGIDDDHDGFVDDVNGADVAANDGDPSDSDGHGTHVAGIIAAQENNIGGVGIAPAAKIMIVRVLGDGDSGTTSQLADGIRYAIAHHATVINTSVNGPAPDDNLRSAVAQASAAGIPIFASAGNNGHNLALTPSYPASYPSADLVSVAALDLQGLLASFSNFGTLVPVGAPGVSIFSTALGGDYEERTGTSAAAPEAAAAFALLRSARPDLGTAALLGAMKATARRGAGLAGVLGSGQLDLVGALRSVVPESAWHLTLAARMRTRGRKRSLVTWAVTGDTSRVARFRVTSSSGSTLARRDASGRGAWVPRRRGRVRVSALDASGTVLGSAAVKLG